MTETNSTAARKWPQDLTGFRFGMLVAECQTGLVKGHRLWKCKCDCGNTIETRRCRLVAGVTKSCGCLYKKYKPIVAGDRYGAWTAVKKDETRKNYWICKCECGCERSVFTVCLKTGTSRSCGCQARIKADHGCVGRTHRIRHGMAKTDVYGIWRGMIARTTGDNVPKRYSDVRVCSGWHDFEVFYRDMGDRPSKSHSIDRINTWGHYSCGACDECLANGHPMNCRWATRRQQANNRRDTAYITIDGVTRPRTEWADITGISAITIRGRICRGWDAKDAVTQPPRHKTRNGPRMLVHDGCSRTLAEWAKLIGISMDTLWHRLNSGWSVSDAVTLPLGSKPIVLARTTSPERNPPVAADPTFPF